MTQPSIEVSKQIRALKIPFQIPLRPGVLLERFVYVYLIYGDREVWLIDSGVAGSETAIFDCLRRDGRDSSQITHILQTHAHPDHIGSTCAIKQATGCRAAIHEAERAWLEDVERQEVERPVPGFRSLVGGSAKVDMVIGDGDVLATDSGYSIRVLHTPGHSPGSVSLWLDDDRALIVGDAVLVPGAMPIFDDFMASLQSAQRLLEFDGVELLLSSWDDPRQGDDARRRLEAGLDCLRALHEMVHKLAREVPGLEPMDFCRETVARLGLPELAANPLVGKALQSTLATCQLDDSSDVTP